MSVPNNASSPFRMTTDAKHQFNRSHVEYPKIQVHPSSYGGNTAHSFQSTTDTRRDYSSPSFYNSGSPSRFGGTNISNTYSASQYSPSQYSHNEYSNQHSPSYHQIGQYSNYRNGGRSSTQYSSSAGEPHVIAEHFVERDVRLPRRVIREDVIERMIIVPEKVVIEEFVEETKKVRETIIEVARPIIEEKIIEIPEYEYRERIVEVPERIIQEKIVEVPKIEIVERNVAVPRIVYEEKSVEIPVYEYRDVITEKVVEVPQIVEEIVIKEVAKPVYVEIQVPEYKDVKVDKIVNRSIPVPVEVSSQLELKVPKIRTNYERVDFPVFVPRFVEVAVPAEFYDQQFHDKAATCSELLNSMLLQGGQGNNPQTGGASLSELEDVAARIQQMNFEETMNEPVNTSLLAQRWSNGLFDIDPYSIKSVCRSVNATGKIITEAVSIIAKKTDEDYLQTGQYGSANRDNLAPSTATTATLETNLCYSGNRGADMMTLTDMDTQQRSQPSNWEERTQEMIMPAPYASLSLSQKLQHDMMQPGQSNHSLSSIRQETVESLSKHALVHSGSSQVNSREHRTSMHSGDVYQMVEPVVSIHSSREMMSNSFNGPRSNGIVNSASMHSETPPNLDDEEQSYEEREFDEGDEDVQCEDEYDEEDEKNEEDEEEDEDDEEDAEEGEEEKATFDEDEEGTEPVEEEE